MHNHSYENEFNLHVNEISFSYEKMGTKTRFEEEAKGNLEMAHWRTENVKLASPHTLPSALRQLLQTKIFLSKIDLLGPLFPRVSDFALISITFSLV